MMMKSYYTPAQNTSILQQVSLNKALNVLNKSLGLLSKDI